jgi:hypothetical protein
MENYAPNSHKAKAEAAKEKKVEKVVKGDVRIKKKGGLSSITDVFISEDASNVKSYIVVDVLVPAIKNAVVDIVTDGINMIFFGGTGRGSARRGSVPASYVSYDRFSDRGQSHNTRDNFVPRASASYEGVVMRTKYDADNVLDQADNLVREYGQVSIADLCEMMGVPSKFTDVNYGWTNLSTAEVVRERDGGYSLRMPRVVQIDNRR